MTTVMMPPGAQRLRALHPLIDGDGSCTIIYDLERGTVLDVPVDLQFHVAPALETGDLDEDLLDWLNDADLLTLERFAGTSEEGGFDLSRPSAWDGFEVRDGEIHVRMSQPATESLLAALDVSLRQGMGASSVTLHLSWGGAYPGDELLSRIVAEASHRAACARQEVRFELTLDAWAVTAPVAAFLEGCPALQVRLKCGSFPAFPAGPTFPGEDRVWSFAERGIRLLAGAAERVTAQFVLAGPARLHELWIWAQQVGVRHLDTLRLDERPGRPIPAAGVGSALRQYRGDLLAICDEICRALEDGRAPIEYQPLTRSVRRLMRSEPLGAPEAYRHTLSDEPWCGFDDAEALEATDFEAVGGAACANCWARYLCDHSRLAVPPGACSDRREPAPDLCAGWRIEVEVALRLYHRLAQVDALQVRRFFEEAGEVPADLGGRRGGVWQQRVAF